MRKIDTARFGQPAMLAAVICALLSALPSLSADPRTWTSLSGATVEAEHIKSEGGTVYLRKADGTQLAIPLERLSESDREYVRDLTPAVIPATRSAGPTSGIMIGFRGDNGGVFPDDCRIAPDFDGPSGHNIVWKCPLPNWGNSSPIVVGKKAFVLCEAATPATGDAPMIDTPLLLCIDADSGRELWRRPIDAFASIPDQAEADRLRAARRAYYEEAHRANLAGEKGPYADWQNKSGITERFAPYGYFDSWIWNRVGMGACMSTPVSDGRRVFVSTGHRTMTAFDLDGKLLWQEFHHEVDTTAHVEWNGMSPVVVGDRVLMHRAIEGTQAIGLRCYDAATGKVLWTTPTEFIPHNAMASPQVLRLPKPDGGVEPAVFCFSGELIRVRDGKVLTAKVGWCKRCAGLGSDGVDRIFMACGWHGGGTRKADEPWYPERFGIVQEKAPLNQEQRLNICVKFALQGDEAVPELLWAERGGWQGEGKRPRNERIEVRDNLDPYPVYHDGRLYLAEGQVWDAATGKVLAWHADFRNPSLGLHGVALAGNHIIGHAGSVQAKDIQISFTPLDGNGLTGETFWRMLEQREGNAEWMNSEWKTKVKAETGNDSNLSSYSGWHASYALPFVSGNRLFIRTFDYLWCIGDKSEPFRPSAAFAEGGPR